MTATATPALTIKDLQQLQAASPDLRMELVNGEIRVMSPSGGESDWIAGEIFGELRS